VNDVSFAQLNWTEIDNTANFSTNCNNVSTDILTFSISGEIVPATIDAVNHTITSIMPAGSDLSSLSPAITVSSGATINPASDITQNFSLTVNYTVTAENPSVSQVWQVSVLEENIAPTDIMLSNSAINENNAVNDLIGTLTSVDLNVNANHTYTLVSGTGDDDNASFSISGNSLQAAEAFNYETKNIYSIRIQTDDGRGGLYHEIFEITVNDIEERQNQTISFASISPVGFEVGSMALNATASSNLAVAYTVISGPATVAGNVLTFTGAGSVTVQATQVGNIDFFAAASVDQTFCINPVKPVITASYTNPESPVLTSSATTNNQWSLDGTALVGETQTSLTVSEEGSYAVTVTVGGCSRISDAEIVIVTDINEVGATSISLYPNPVADHITINYANPSQVHSVHIMNSTGNHLVQGGEELVNRPIDVSSFQSGLYWTKLLVNGKTVTMKFIKN
jgi:hypothetical protein